MTEYQITEYNQTAAALAILRDKYSGQLFEVSTTKGMNEAKEARAEVKGYRVALEKVRVEIKAPALERTRLIDAEAKRITAELLAIEEPIDQQIKTEEQRKEEEKAAKAKAEAARITGIAAKISAIRHPVSLVANPSATVIQAELEKALALELSETEFQEFMPEAIEALNEARKDLQAALNARLLYEVEQARIKAEQEAKEARIKAEQEELTRLRQADSARQAEQARIAEETRKAEAARIAAEREEQDRRNEAIRQQQAEEAARIAEEAARIATAKAELEARQRQIEEEEAARQRQIEEAKVKAIKPTRKSKAIDPIADLKQALNANAETARALDEAYQRGYQAGLNSAQQAA